MCQLISFFYMRYTVNNYRAFPRTKTLPLGVNVCAARDEIEKHLLCIYLRALFKPLGRLQLSFYSHGISTLHTSPRGLDTQAF